MVGSGFYSAVTASPRISNLIIVFTLFVGHWPSLGLCWLSLGLLKQLPHGHLGLTISVSAESYFQEQIHHLSIQNHSGASHIYRTKPRAIICLKPVNVCFPLVLLYILL